MDPKCAPILILTRAVVGAAVLTAVAVGRSAEASVHRIESDAKDYFIRHWLVVGLFPSVPLAQPTREGYTRDGFARDFLVSLGGESEAVLTTETSVPDVGPPQAVQADANGAVDLTRVYGEGERRVAYLFSWIESAEEQTITFFFSSDDGGQVWVNGEHVHRAWVPGGRGIRFREETFRANLKRGRNRILVKVEQNGPGWAAAVEALPRRIAPALLEPSLQLHPRIRLLERHGAGWSARIAAELNHDATLFPQLRQSLQVYDSAARVVFAATMAAGEEAVIEVEPGAYLLTARSDSPKPIGGEAALLATEDPLAWANRAREQARARSQEGADPASAGWFAYLAEKLDRALARPDDSAAELALQAYRVLRWSAALDADPAAFLQQRGGIEWAYRSTVDGSGQPFTLRIPETYTSAQEWPLVVQLHGAGGTHGERWGDPHPEPTFDLQVNGRGRTGGYQGLSEVDVLEAVAYVQQHWRIDPDQVHLTGGSMGGYGTFSLAARYPDRWASAVPWAGSAAHLPTENMLNLPTYALHSDDDFVVPVSGARAGVRWLNQLGGMAILAETTGFGHQFGRWMEGRANVQQWREGRKRADPRTIRRIPPNDVALYEPGSALVAMNASREPAPDFMLVDRTGRLIAARRFDSRWHWEPGYELSPRRASAANDAAAARMRQALACDFVVQEHATGEQAPWNHGPETRVADVAAFAYSHRLATLTLSGAEIRQVGVALERGSIRIWPRSDLADIEDDRRYRVGLVGLDMRGFVRATRLEPEDFALVDLTLRDVLWPE